MNYLIKYSNFENLSEKKSYYKEGDIVYIEYWYNKMITKVRIKEIKGRKFLVSHNISESKIKNAPDEIIKSTQIISKL
jgi:hypothetical protein